ncbi:ABC transporter permease family protein [Paenibacillus tarimensis]|uniref:hypothetical protein n=1 Tax=Paenibacillus tarimensis TaxID=416012 RepID=UPI002E1E51FC
MKTKSGRSALRSPAISRDVYAGRAAAKKRWLTIERKETMQGLMFVSPWLIGFLCFALGPLLYVNDEALYTLQIGLQTFKGTNDTQWHYLMAASLLVLLPVILLFFFFQRYFIEGMDLTAGTKG